MRIFTCYGGRVIVMGFQPVQCVLVRASDGNARICWKLIRLKQRNYKVEQSYKCTSFKLSSSGRLEVAQEVKWVNGNQKVASSTLHVSRCL